MHNILNNHNRQLLDESNRNSEGPAEVIVKEKRNVR